MAPLWVSGKSQHTYPVKGHRENIFGSEGYLVSVATT